MSERKLATIRRIDALTPIEGADKIEVASIGGWKIVCQKGLYEVGDLAVYFEIDSFIPNDIAPFLTKPGQYPKVYEGVEGQRLKTIRLRGQISQGLLMPVHNDITGTYLMIYTDETGEYSLTVAEGDDVTEALGILKWEKPIPACLAGISRGNFPTQIPKTDQSRVQNLKKEIELNQNTMMEVTEKCEGSSMTCYLIDGEFGVCSRNLNLKEVEGNTFWDVARAENIEVKIREVFGSNNVALQGELIGPGVQGNIYKLNKHEFRVFDIYDVDAGAYLRPEFRRALVDKMGLVHVPILDDCLILDHAIDELLALAEGKSRISPTEREGLVFKALDSNFTFKAISNRYLLKGGE
jgi:RNA ligase (TIGR02306 family)